MDAIRIDKVRQEAVKQALADEWGVADVSNADVRACIADADNSTIFHAGRAYGGPRSWITVADALSLSTSP